MMTTQSWLADRLQAISASMQICTLKRIALVAAFAGAASCTLPPTALAPAPTAKLDTGIVQGTAEGALSVYRGIPYAAAPVGPLRWQAPEPALGWPGIREATAFGAACVQPHVSDEPWAQVGPQSEDCLFLNIWQPKSDNTHLPVMVFIHGGSLRAGAAGVPLYDGTALARRGAVIVTINYRLGRLGYFAHPALSHENTDGLLGNYGLMDQIAALRWVRRNIAAFGGDADNVTIFGESAGATSVQALMTSPEARGLFAKAVSESGGGYSFAPPLAAAEMAGEAWAAQQGLPHATAAQLRTLPADQIATATDLIGLMADGHLLQDSPVKTFMAGDQAAVPLIIGGNTYEASLKALDQNLVRQIVGPAYDDLLAGYQQQGDRVSPEDRLITQSIAIQPSRYLAELQAALGEKSYVYLFGQQAASERDTVPGAVHGGELSYLFGTRLSAETWDEEDERISRTMGDYWVNFARTGDPSGSGLPEWEPAKPANSRIMVIHGEASMRDATPLENATLEAGARTAKRIWGKAE